MMDPALECTPDLSLWPAIASKARVPRSLGLDLDRDIPLMPSLHTHICSRATGEVSHFLPTFSSKIGIGPCEIELYDLLHSSGMLPIDFCNNDTLQHNCLSFYERSVFLFTIGQAR